MNMRSLEQIVQDMDGLATQIEESGIATDATVEIQHAIKAWRDTLQELIEQTPIF